MQLYPFSLVRIAVATPDGKPLYRQPLWLIVMGEERQRLALTDNPRGLQPAFRPGAFPALHQLSDPRHSARGALAAPW
jgi:hypothetical protein